MILYTPYPVKATLWYIELVLENTYYQEPSYSTIYRGDAQYDNRGHLCIRNVYDLEREMSVYPEPQSALSQLPAAPCSQPIPCYG